MKIELTEKYLKQMRVDFFPMGSGPLVMMRVIVRLIDAIADEKGFDVGQREKPLK